MPWVTGYLGHRALDGIDQSARDIHTDLTEVVVHRGLNVIHRQPAQPDGLGIESVGGTNAAAQSSEVVSAEPVDENSL
jgi:hypothetical protein